MCVIRASYLLTWTLCLLALCRLAAAAPMMLPGGFLSTRGSQIVGPNGVPVRITSVGIGGMNVVGGRLELVGPSHWGMADHVAAIKANGFNCVRIQWIDKTLDDPGAMAQLDQFVAACGKVGLKVIFDNHNNEGTPADWSNSAQQKNGLWFDKGPGTDGTDGGGDVGTVTADKFLRDWVTFARHWAGNPTVIGFDIRNEPCFRASTPEYWGGNGPTDIHAMYQNVGNAILAVDPGALIICEAIGYWPASAGEHTFSGIRSLPIVLVNPAKLVYSIHEYPREIAAYPEAEFGPEYIARMNRTWGWIVKENIAPVWIGEMGASMISTGSKAWGATLLSYMNGLAADGPVFHGAQQGISGDWWMWGDLNGQNPDGCLGDNGTLRPEQAVFITQMKPRPYSCK